ncbi:MAG TPA: hypothetical protein VEA80_15045 [Vitreimonas sp.]|uniref:hypothetical protein n=1 Tax=Vitreimonas sp. TaxID=3069702 RepID=UPI002D40ABF5|nr:hypothetical protein [Vitreimonas sp.]HYD88789.1 hypothetical protein [Vitreimonas sp.]
MQIGRVVGAAALVGAGVLAYRAMKKRKQNSEGEQLQAHPMPNVRDAGAENMSSAPKRWSRTDERSDESFPASDAPSTY